MFKLLTPSRGLRLAAIFLVLALTVGCDQASKHFARSTLSGQGSISSAGGFVEFTLAENPGAFLSLGDALPQAVRTIAFTFCVGLGLLALSTFLLTSPRLGWMCFMSLTLVWAGGVSNLIDRCARQGLVTDFMLIRVGPLHTGIFNAADAIILVGAAGFMLSHWLRQKAGAGVVPHPSDD